MLSVLYNESRVKKREREKNICLWNSQNKSQRRQGRLKGHRFLKFDWQGYVIISNTVLFSFKLYNRATLSLITERTNIFAHISVWLKMRIWYRYLFSFYLFFFSHFMCKWFLNEWAAVEMVWDSRYDREHDLLTMSSDERINCWSRCKNNHLIVMAYLICS